MEIKVHDIVQFESIDHLEKIIPIPDWVKDAPASKNYGVVRRMPITNQIVPIGLRGNTREQRFGTFIHERNIIQIITPNSLVERMEQFKNERYFPTLNMIKEAFQQLNLVWGLTGSIGFEIATSIKVTTPNSDIDLCLYQEEIQRELLLEIGNFLETLDTRVDVQVEIPSMGAFLLNDYLHNEESGFIVRTPFGPHLCTTKHNKIKLLG